VTNSLALITAPLTLIFSASNAKDTATLPCDLGYTYTKVEANLKAGWSTANVQASAEVK
jgi:hypothetical protein